MSLYFKTFLTLIMMNFLTGCSFEDFKSFWGENSVDSEVQAPIESNQTLTSTVTSELPTQSQPEISTEEETSTLSDTPSETEVSDTPIPTPPVLTTEPNIPEPTQTPPATVAVPLIHTSTPNEALPVSEVTVEPTPIAPVVAPEPAPVVEPTPTEELPQQEVTPEPIATTNPPETVIPQEEVNGEESPTQPTVETEETPISQILCTKGDAIQAGHIVDTYTGRGMKNVLVTLNGCTTQTDENGFYIFTQIAASEKATLVIQADKSYLHSEVIAVTKYNIDNNLSTNFVEYKVGKYHSRWSYYSNKGMSSTRSEISSSTTYTDNENHIFNGIIQAGWIFKDTMSAQGRDTFPGLYEGIDDNGVLVPFVAYGFISLELKNATGNFLNVSENITLKFTDITGTTQETIALWSYNYTEGQWIQEGYAQRDEDGTYIAEVSQPGTWSLCQAIQEDPGIFRGRIINVEGQGLAQVRVKAVGQNWIGKDLTTDENGNFEINVIPDSPFRLKAYNYKDEYAAEYSQVIAGIASGAISEDK